MIARRTFLRSLLEKYLAGEDNDFLATSQRLLADSQEATARAGRRSHVPRNIDCRPRRAEIIASTDSAAAWAKAWPTPPNSSTAAKKVIWSRRPRMRRSACICRPRWSTTADSCGRAAGAARHSTPRRHARRRRRLGQDRRIVGRQPRGRRRRCICKLRAVNTAGSSHWLTSQVMAKALDGKAVSKRATYKANRC